MNELARMCGLRPHILTSFISPRANHRLPPSSLDILSSLSPISPPSPPFSSPLFPSSSLSLSTPSPPILLPLSLRLFPFYVLSTPSLPPLSPLSPLISLLSLCPLPLPFLISLSRLSAPFLPSLPLSTTSPPSLPPEVKCPIAVLLDPPIHAANAACGFAARVSGQSRSGLPF